MVRKPQERSEVNARRERVYKLWCRGWPEVRIAEKEGVHKSQICRDITARRKEINCCKEGSAERDAAARDRAIGTYEEVIAEAFTEWERSKKDKERQRSKVRQKAGKAKAPKSGKASPALPLDETTEAEQATEGRLGDPQYLRAAITAQQRIDEINGLVKQRHEHFGEVKVTHSTDPSQMTEDEIDARLAEIRAERGDAAAAGEKAATSSPQVP